MTDTDTTPAPATDTAELEAQIRVDVERELRAELADRMAEQPATPAAPGATLDLSGKTQAERAECYCDWPNAKAPSDLPQPWDLRAQNLHREAELAPGAANTIAPIVVSHRFPILSSGSADPGVHVLGRALGALGFENTVSKGLNPFGAVDQSVMGAVHAFRSVFGVLEDPSGFGGHTPAGQAAAAAHIGPWTWEAVLRAAEHAATAKAA